MHRVAEAVQNAVEIPLLHLADATAERIVAAGLDTVGLLGTRFTMEQDFYRARLEQYGLKVLVPGPDERTLVHDVIYRELCLGEVKDSSREQFLRVIRQLAADGAQAIIEGCTEITMLVEQQHTDILLFDTTSIHAEAAVERALATGCR